MWMPLLGQKMVKYKNDMIDDSTDSFIGISKAALIALVTWVAGAFMKNPIGTAGAILGLLYMYEKWRTQRHLRRKAEKESETEKKEEDGEIS